MYRNNAQRKREEIGRLSQNKVREQKRLSDLSAIINRASQAASRSTNVTVAQSKLREIERHQKDSIRIEKKVADLSVNIARKQKELLEEEKKISREELKERKKQEQELKKRNSEYQKNMSNINTKLTNHHNLHQETKAEIRKLKQLPDKVVVLFLAANPVDLKQLRLGQEVREINEMMRKAKHRDSVKLESVWALRPVDVLQAINEHSPAVVHFSGHGSKQDEIIFEDNEGNAKAITKEAIVQTMMASSEGIRIVFFNTCYSSNQAKSIVEYVEAAVGMNNSVGDVAARIFSSQFYSSLGFGHSVKKAFEQAKALLMLEGVKEEDTPELFTHKSVNAEELFIVKAPSETGMENQEN